MRLLTKFILTTVAIFLMLAIALSTVSTLWINQNTIRDAQHRVEVAIRWAREAFNQKNRDAHQVLAVVAQNELLRDFLDNPRDPKLAAAVQEKFNSFRLQHRMDILNIVSADGTVLLRTRPPFNRGDDISDNPFIRHVLLHGKSIEGAIVIGRSALVREGESLLERAVDSTGEPNGMFTGTAVPVMRGGKLIGIISSGILINGNNDFIDTVRDAVSYGDYYKGRSVGTATIFMGDKRIATNVVGSNAGRATGTAASTEVADMVLLRGQSWSGRAWVVDAWYLSYYEPIRDPDNNLIGMLYVGELEQKYRDIRFRAVVSVVSVIFVAMLLSIAMFILIARSILEPVRKLRDATARLIKGERSARVTEQFGGEMGDLTRSFNNMADDIEKHTAEIERKQRELGALNNELEMTNRNYIDMLGFISHELKNPLASAVLSLHTVKDGYLGELNEKQKKGLDNVAESLDYFKELIRSYLDLSKLEKGDYVINRRNTALKAMVIDPAINGLAEEMRKHHMTLDIGVHEETMVDADPDLLRIVYDNLIGNAVKYGRDGGVIRLREKVRDGRQVFSVYNEGAGIPREKMDLLFKKFSRIYSQENAGKRGSGLGLYACREILQKHGGKIWAESEPGKWVEFSFEIG